MNDLGEKLIIGRNYFGYSRKHLSEILNLRKETIGRIERNEIKRPHYETLFKIANMFGTTVVNLVNDDLETFKERLANNE